jgi:fibronectin-binding autotransporter adhesin
VVISALSESYVKWLWRAIFSGLLILTSLSFAAQLFLKPAQAAVGINKQINFQGKIVNGNGTNVANGSYSFTFSIYNVSTGGSALWTETKSLTVTDGVFQTALGSSTTLPGSIDFNSDSIYLGVNFNSDGEMSPRIQFTSVAQAFNAEKLGGLTNSQFVQLAQGLQTDATTGNASIAINKTAASGSLIQLQRGGADVLLIDNSGYLTFKPASDNTAAFKVVQNASGNATVFVADTSNRRVGINVATPGYTLDVGGDVNSTGVYRVSGVQISSANLSNDGNLAKLNVAQIFTNTNTFNVNSATAVKVERTGVNSNTFVVDTTAARVGINTAPTTYALEVNGDASASNFRTSGGITHTTANNAQVNTTSTGTEVKRNVADTNVALKVIQANASSTGDIVQFQNSSVTVASVGISGATLFKNSANSSIAFQIQSSGVSGDTLFKADTSANRLFVGNSTASAGADTTLLVVDSAATGNLPTGVNGGIVYDSDLNKFKVYENSAYKVLCNTTDLGCGNAVTLQQAYNNSSPATITLADNKNLVFGAPDTTTDPGIFFNLQCTTCSAGGGQFQVQSQGVNVFTVYPDGSKVDLVSRTNSTTHFNLQDTNNFTYFQGDSTHRSIGIGTNGSTPNAILQIRDGNAAASRDLVNVTSIASGSDKSVLVIDQHGYTTFKNDTDNAAAFKIQDANANPVLVADSSNKRIGIGKNPGSFALDVNGTGAFSSTVRATQFIDVDNTAYYLDPASATASAILNGPLSIGTTTTPASDIFFGEGTNRTMSVQTRNANAGGNSFTITSGAGGAGAGANAGGNLVLQGGAGGGTNGNGGNVFVYGGAKNGSGNDGNIILGHNGTSSLGNVGIGNLSPTAKLDIVNSGTSPYTATGLQLQSTFTSNSGATSVNQKIATTNGGSGSASTTRGLEITTTDAGSLANTNIGIYVNPVTANTSDTEIAAILGGSVRVGSLTNPAYPLDVTGDINSSTALRIGGTQICTSSGCVAVGAVSLQATSPGTAQTGNLNITGTAIAGTSVLTQALDTASNQPLTIGAATASAITIGKNSSPNTLTLQGNGSSTFVVNNGTNTTTLSFANPTADVNYQFNTATAGTYTICSSASVCSGYQAAGSYVTLQGATPGSAQTGNINVTGTVLGGVVQGGTVNGTTKYQLNGTDIVDASRNITNIGNITGTGAVTLSSTGGGNALTLSSGSGTIQAGSNNFNTTGNVTAGNVSATSSVKLNNVSDSSGSLTKAATVGTGGVSAGDAVVMLSDSGTAKVVRSSTARDPKVYGVATGTVAVGNPVDVVISGNTTVTADEGAVSIGDQLVISNRTAGAVMTDNNAITGIVGIALSTKTAGATGSTGSVSVSVRPVNGQLTPKVQTTAASAFSVQNAGGTAVFNVDTSATTVTVTGSIVTTTINATSGINTGAGAGTQRIDASGNLANIGTLTLSGAISGGTTYSGSGNINTTGGSIQTNSITRITNTGSLTNIGDISGTGAVTISSGGSGGLTLDSASNILQIAASDTSIQRSAGGAFSFDLADSSAATTFTITNSNGSQVANLSVEGGVDIGSGQSYKVGGTQISSTALSNDNNLAKLSASQTFAGNNIFSGSGNGTTTVGTVFRNASNSATAFQIQNQSNGMLLNFDTTGSGALTVGGSVVAGSLSTGSGSGTLRLDGSGNLSNIGTLSLSGAISGGTTYTGSGNINTTGGGVQTNSVTRVANNGDLTNIGNITGTAAMTISSGGSGNIVLDSASNILQIAASDTTMQRTAAGTYTFDLVDSSAATTLAVTNSNATQVANLTVEGTVTGANVVGAIVNATTSINTGAGTGTQRIDASGNLSNIGTIGLSGAISGGTTYTGSGNINTTGGGIQTNSVTRISNSGNLTNIGDITGTAAVTLSSGGSGSLTLDSASNILQLAASDTTVQRNAAGTYNFDLLDASGATTLNVTNSDATQVANLTVEGGVSIGSGQTYKINGTQISSTALSNDANLAKLNGTQTFSGTNTFSNTVLLTGVDTSTATTLSIGATTASALTVGNTAAAVTIQGSASTVLKATSGASTTTVGFITPTANVTYQFATASTGTYSICTTATICSGYAATGSFVNLQGTTPGTAQVGNINLTGTILGTNITAGTSLQSNGTLSSSGTATLAGNILTADTTQMKVRIGTGTPSLGTGTTGALYVSDAAEFAGRILIGTTSNGADFNSSTHEVSFTGSARHTAKITIPAEYAGAVLDAPASNNTGTMTAGFDSSLRYNFYKWTTGQATAQSYDVVVQIPVPSDFSAWSSSTPANVLAYTSSTTTGTIAATLYDTAGTVETGINGAVITPTANTTWQTRSLGTVAGTYTAGGVAVLRLRLTAPTSGDTRVGTITLDYLSKY